MNIRDIGKLGVSLAAPLLAGGLGAVFTSSKIPSWYAALAKPELNPPSWIFGPVWTTLYILMGIALYLVWRKGVKTKGVRIALTAFVVQLVLNAIWSPIFFGAEAPGIAFAVIAAMWVAIMMTIFLFWRISKPAALLLVPYIAWVSFASYLNYAIWQLN